MPRCAAALVIEGFLPWLVRVHDSAIVATRRRAAERACAQRAGAAAAARARRPGKNAASVE
ncbi:MAG: hypothetical protein DCC71_23775, partial [Proteobacteria bacterium]